MWNFSKCNKVLIISLLNLPGHQLVPQVIRAAENMALFAVSIDLFTNNSGNNRQTMLSVQV